jgi:hypothetical protein
MFQYSKPADEEMKKKTYFIRGVKTQRHKTDKKRTKTYFIKIIII